MRSLRRGGSDCDRDLGLLNPGHQEDGPQLGPRVRVRVIDPPLFRHLGVTLELLISNN